MNSDEGSIICGFWVSCGVDERMWAWDERGWTGDEGNRRDRSMGVGKRSVGVGREDGDKSSEEIVLVVGRNWSQLWRVSFNHL
jgi:hypothetical protein